MNRVPLATRRLAMAVVGLSAAQMTLARGLHIVRTGAFVLEPPSLPFHPWTLATAWLVETNVVQLALHVALLVVCGRYLERAYEHPRAFAALVAICGVASTVATLVALAIRAAAARDTAPLATAAIGGLGGVLGGFAVAFKQLIPEHTVNFLGGAMSMRVKHVPSALVAMQLFLLLLGFDAAAALMVISGTVAAWVYLRFFRMRDGVQGDLSERFGLASFVPEATHGVLRPLTTAVYRSLVRLRLLPPPPPASVRRAGAFGALRAGGRGNALLSPTLAAPSPAGAAPDVIFDAGDPLPVAPEARKAERHKHLALQAVAERIKDSG